MDEARFYLLCATQLCMHRDQLLKMLQEHSNMLLQGSVSRRELRDMLRGAGAAAATCSACMCQPARCQRTA